LTIVSLEDEFPTHEIVRNDGAGVMLAIPMYWLAMLVNLVGYWFFGLPVSYTLGFVMGLGPRGLWYGLVLGLAAVATILLVRVRLALARERRRVLIDHPGLESELGA
jgi:MATE family multidrug resistance protein